MGSPRVIGWALVALTAAGCPHPAAAPRPESVAPLAPWQAQVEAAAAGGPVDLDVSADGQVAATFTARAGARLGDAELTSPVGGGAIALLAPGGQPRWVRSVAAPPGAVAISGDLVVAALAADGAIDLGGATVALRGQPGAVLWGLGAGDGEPRFTVPIGATDWVVVRDLAGLPGGDVAVAGSFTGTLRLGDRVVSSAGSTDGFVARVGGDGTPRWLIRIGGADGDGVSGVAAAPDGVAVAGTFAGEAEIRGVALTSLDDTILPDGFVASLDGDGGVRWARTFGSSEDDQVAGVAVTPGGVVAVAATIRGVGAAIGDRGVMVRGLADAVVVAWDAAGTRRLTRVIGGQDLDTASAIAAVGDELVVGVTYAGTVALDSTTLTADGGDGAAIVVLDGRGEIRRALDVAGPGRETVAALAGTPAGFAAVIRHTAGATLDGATLAAPADPYGGGAILVRGE